MDVNVFWNEKNIWNGKKIWNIKQNSLFGGNVTKTLAPLPFKF